MKKTFLLNVILTLILSASCFAANAGNTGNYNNQFNPGSTSPNVNFPKRDPFTTSNKMYLEMGRQSGIQGGFNNGFIPGYGNQKLPKMRMKGYVNKSKQNAAALLDVEGAGVYKVRKGDQIGLHAIGLNTVLEVMEISPNGVKVRTGQINQVIVVR